MKLHHLSLDRLEELLPTMTNGGQVAVVAGITGDKSQQFAGEATARIEIVQSVNVVDRFRAFVVDLEKRVSARLIDSDGKKIALNGANPADSADSAGNSEAAMPDSQDFTP
jgi:hypothetical protein